MLSIGHQFQFQISENHQYLIVKSNVLADPLILSNPNKFQQKTRHLILLVQNEADLMPTL